MQKIPRYAYDIVLFTANSYFTIIEAVNLKQTLTVQFSLNGYLTTHILAELTFFILTEFSAETCFVYMTLSWQILKPVHMLASKFWGRLHTCKKNFFFFF